MRQRARQILRDVWGHNDFRPGQIEVIEAIAEARDVLAVLPTGTGKSICYQLPALLTESLTLVVTPLIALMRDQVDSLKERGVSATFIDSTLSTHEIDQRLTDAEFGRYRLLYLAPERLASTLFSARIDRLQVGTLAVDEAHCISEWGQSFRPAYLDIAASAERLGRPNVAALTATATPRVRKDIVTQLRLKDPVRVVTGFDRPNLVWSAFTDGEKRGRIRAILGAVDGPGVVYVGTRRNVEKWSEWILSLGVSAARYHGGLNPQERSREQAKWMSGRARVMVATNAFGMGIDKPDVRFVVHVDIPASLETYYQEAGRAGRDGQKSHVALLYANGDERLQRILIDRSYPPAKDTLIVYDIVCSAAGVPIGAECHEPIDVDVERVGKTAGIRSTAVRSAIDLLERQGVWTILNVGPSVGMLRLDAGVRTLRGILDRPVSEDVRAVASHLLRRDFPVMFGGWQKVDVKGIARSTSLTEQSTLRVLRYLGDAGFLAWREPREGVLLGLIGPRQKRVSIDEASLRKARRGAESRLRDLLRYVRSSECRRNGLLAYFGEGARGRCGRCDNCLRRRRIPVDPKDEDRLSGEILIDARSGLPRSEWRVNRYHRPDLIDACIDRLIRDGRLRPSPRLDDTFEVNDESVR